MAREVSHLPEFTERDGLVAKLTVRADGHAETTADVDKTEDQIEVEHTSPLGALLSSLRVEVVQLHGRLQDELPREFVETLFPEGPSQAAPKDPTQPDS